MSEQKNTEIFEKGERSIQSDLGYIITLVLSAIVFLCLLTRDALFSSVGSAVADFILGVFGFSSYAFTPAVIVFCVLKIIGVRAAGNKKTIAGLCVMLIAAVFCLQMITSSVSEISQGMKFGEYISQSFQLLCTGPNGASAGGVLSSVILYPMVYGIKTVGCYVIFALLFLAALLSVVGKYLFAARIPLSFGKKKKGNGFNPAEEYRDEYVNPTAEAQASLYVYGGKQAEFKTKSYFEQRRDRRARDERDEDEGYTEFDSSATHVQNINEEEDVISFDPSVPKNSSYVEDYNNNVEERRHWLFSKSENTDDYYNLKRSGTQTERQVVQNDVISDPILPTTSASDAKSVLFRKMEVLSDETLDAYEKKGAFSTEKQEEKVDPVIEEVKEEKKEDPYAMFRPVFPKEMPTILKIEDLPEKEENAPEEATTVEEPKELSYQEKIQGKGYFSVDEILEDKESPRVADTIIPLDPNLILKKDEVVEIPPKLDEPKQENVSRFIISDSNREIPQAETAPSVNKKEEFTELKKTFREEDLKLDPVNTADFEEIAPKNFIPETFEEPRKIVKNENVDFSRSIPAGNDLKSVETGRVLPNPIVKKEEVKQPVEEKKDAPPVKLRPYTAPPISLLADIPDATGEITDEILENKTELENVLATFKIPAKVTDIIVGPSVTKYELEISQGISVKRVEACAADISLWLKAPSEVIIEAPIPGKNRIGVEVPLRDRKTVGLRCVIESEAFRTSKSAIAFGMGKDVYGNSIICDIKKMPHLLIAGATGMGKSVCLNTLLISILYRSSPEDVRLILIDPKKVEFNVFSGLPHLMINDIVSESAKAVNALNWAINEMESRFTKFQVARVRELDEYNDLAVKNGQPKLPRIVIVCDEVAELMTTNKKEVEVAIQRLAQKARAAGIHLVLATQRPSVDVITGVIKANLNSRIACHLSNGIDSRTILDEVGAEKLLDKGDMFYHPASMPEKMRLQGAYISTDEVRNVVDFVIANNDSYFDPAVSESINFVKSDVPEKEASSGGGHENELDDLFIEALSTAIDIGNISISMIQRKFLVGYPRAGKILDTMERMGYVSAQNGSKPREVLLTRAEFNELYGDQE